MTNDLTIKYLQNKVRQASDDLAMFTMMLKEQKEMSKGLEDATRRSKFLSLVANKEEKNEEV